MSTMKSITTWMKHSWRPAAAYVYLIICLSDFMVMPIIYAGIAKNNNSLAAVQLALQFKDSASQIEALKELRSTDSWDPLTLKSNGLFHMAFGGILGVAAWTRGKEKIAALENGQDPNDTGSDSNTPPDPISPPPAPVPAPTPAPVPAPVSPTNPIQIPAPNRTW